MIVQKFPRFPRFPEFPMLSGEFPAISPLGIRMRGLGKPAASGIEVDFSELKELLDMLVGVRKSEDQNSEVAPNKVEKEKPFAWSTSEYDVDDVDDGDGDGDDNEEPYIHEPDVIMHEDDEEDEDYDGDDEPPSSKLDSGLAYDLVEPDAYEDDIEGEKEEDEGQNSHMPKSILEMKLEDIFGPIVSNKAFKDALRENPPPPKKDPFVFIANRMTFLVQTLFPLVFDTSLMDNGSNSLTIAVNEDKTYPKLRTIDDLGFITSEINRSSTIQKEIGEYLDGTGFSNIYCFPSTIVDKRHTEVLMAVKFVLYPKRKYTNF